MIERRVRVNLKSNAKGKVTPDVTVELSGEVGLMDALNEANKLYINAKRVAVERSD